jgi:cobaltochelatase CobN
LAERGVQLILVPGDDRPDPELSGLSTVGAEDRDASGSTCARAAWAMPWAFSLPGQRWLGRDYAWAEPQALPRTAIYHPHKVRRN